MPCVRSVVSNGFIHEMQLNFKRSLLYMHFRYFRLLASIGMRKYASFKATVPRKQPTRINFIAVPKSLILKCVQSTNLLRRFRFSMKLWFVGQKKGRDKLFWLRLATANCFWAEELADYHFHCPGVRSRKFNGRGRRPLNRRLSRKGIRYPLTQDRVRRSSVLIDQQLLCLLLAFPLCLPTRRTPLLWPHSCGYRTGRRVFKVWKLEVVWCCLPRCCKQVWQQTSRIDQTG